MNEKLTQSSKGRLINTYHESISGVKLNKKEFELAFKTDLYHFDRDYLWNGGGDGLSFRYVKLNIENRFREKGLVKYLINFIPYPDPLPNEETWVNTKHNELTTYAANERLSGYND